MNNKVIIVGGDHHNGLGLARMFGIKNIDVIAVIVTDKKYSFVSKSRYLKKSYLFQNESSAFDFILKNLVDSNIKHFLIPYSDGAAMELDLRLNEFMNSFQVPSINNQLGKIAELMNKKKQYEWATNNRIKMAETKEVFVNDFLNGGITWNKFPCILKPIVSAQGVKADITICERVDELNNAVQDLADKGYISVVIQPYLKIDYEIDVFGCICKNSKQIILVPTKTIRAFPNKKGTNCFSQIITDSQIIDKCRQLIIKLQSCGFSGLYDIELLVVDGEIYLNEINYRNSGDDYMVMSQKFFYPLAWMSDALNNDEYQYPDYMDNSTFAMTCWYDYQHVKSKEITFLSWLKDVKKTSDFALYFKGDLKPVYSYYYHCAIGRIKRILKINGKPNKQP